MITYEGQQYFTYGHPPDAIIIPFSNIDRKHWNQSHILALNTSKAARLRFFHTYVKSWRRERQRIGDDMQYTVGDELRNTGANVRIAAIDEAGMMVGPQAIRRPGSASSSSTTSDDMPLLADVASDDELPPLEELPPTPDDVIYCTTSLGGGVRIVAGATRVAAMRFAAEQMFTQMLQQRGSERLLPSLDIAPQANATPEQQCTRCPYHERALVEREVERLLTTVLGSRHVREPRQFLRRILHRILELV